MTAALKPLTYAKVGDLNSEAWDLLIIDATTGESIGSVVEVDCNEGWLVRHALDANGRPQINETRDGVLTERIEGRFLIVRKAHR